MIRFILTIIVVVWDFILGAVLFSISTLIGLVNRPAKDKMNQFIIRLYLGFIGWMSGCKVTYKGLENIPKDKAVMFVGNHSGFFDVIFTYPKLHGNAGYIAKKEFKKIPMLSWAMKLIYCLFLDRNNIKEGLKTVLQAIEYIKSGISVFVFPEGTRSRDGKMLEFKEGSMKIATKSGCPVIPVAISNTAAVFEDNFPRIKAVPVIVEFMKPIEVSELSRDEQKNLGKMLHDLIEEEKLKNDAELGLEKSA